MARKWRPQTFSDLVGQEHIAVTLASAIQKKRISQGYLFTGTRGIGKTSAARIFAKALRCTKPVAPAVPCGKCNDCVEIAEGRSVDVLEIDGASNNGVDAVREIRENVKYLPSTGKYKIYIVDEVHMLTTAAFNALLKTLEEPPAHVIFIFATTDPRKIPETVLSRCQRFDFRRVSQKDLQDRLEKICKTESLTIAPDALAILAREAEGSMRDGVSLLDQILSVAEGKKIEAAALAGALGLVDKQTVLDCVTGILKRDPVRALEAVGCIHLHGFDLKQFAREVLRYFRTIMVAKLVEENRGEPAPYLDVSDVDLADVRALLAERSIEDLDMLFRMLNYGIEDVARSSIPKMVMDVLVIKMASARELTQLRELTGPESFGGSASALEKQQPKPQSQSPLSASSKPAAASAVKSAAQAAPAPAAPAGKPATEGAVLDLEWWRGAVDAVKKRKPLFGTMLEHLSFESARSENESVMVTLGYAKDSAFYKDQLQMSVNREQVLQTLTSHLGLALRLDFKESAGSAAAGVQSLAELKETEKRTRTEERKRKVLESEALQATQRLLGAKLEKLEVKETK
ncbi:MAG: DNA polymerase III subunit gamma/tau [Deltaproteobacteria bacterium]|nr:DNA polymerase III subunit gamma/tau [Deltaproteobacteria bacterium]